jgi:hypothetical protein
VCVVVVVMVVQGVGEWMGWDGVGYEWNGMAWMDECAHALHLQAHM